MKKSTKRFCLKLAAGFLSTTLVASVSLPMQVSATNNDTTRQSILLENDIAPVVADESNWSDKIVSEISSKRTEFSKTYLLEDGSYYSVSSASPIHHLRDGIWVDIDEADSTTPQTISVANEEIATLNASETTTTANVTDTNFTSKCIGTTTYSSGIVNFKSNGAFLIKPSDVYAYSSNNKLVLEATISFDTTSTGQTYIYAREVTSSWDNITQVTDISDEQLIDYDLTTNGSNTVTFNITDIFSKWERGTAEQNGIVLLTPQASSRKSYTATNPVISVRYIDVSENTSRFTNHSVDMGSAGTLYVNDVTNTIRVEQDIIGINLQTLPVKLTRNIYPATNGFNKVAGISSSWNYENAITLESGILTWTQFDGSTIKFVKPDDNIIINEDGYQKWLPVASGLLQLNAALWISEDLADSNGLNADYTQCYIELNDTTYNFNINGKISKISEYGKNITFTYGSIGLSKIVDAAGNKYTFSYDTYSIGVNEYTYVSKIAVKNSDNQTISIDNNEYSVTFNNTYDIQTQKITSTTTYCDNKTCSYVFDLNGRLLEVVDANGSKVVFIYINSLSNVITGFTQYSADSTPSITKSLNIVSENTYSRVFTNENAETEVMRFDENYNLITNYYNGNIVSLDYDDNNIVKAYAYKDSSTDEILDFISPDTWIDNGDILAYIDNGRIEIIGANGKDAIVTQEIADVLVEDKTYVLEAEARTTNAQTNTDGFFGIVITVYDADTIEVIDTISYKFDNTLVCEYTNSQENFGQLRMATLKFDRDVVIDVSICEYGLIGTFEVDNVKLYEATSENTVVGLPNMDNESPVDVLRDENGNIVKESITRDNVSMEQTYEYTSDGSQLEKMTDFNGLTTYYKYNSENGLLEEKGYSINANGEIVNPISYEYNASSLIKKVTQTITDITAPTNSAEIQLSTEYGYDINNRVQSVTSNGVTYSVAYDSAGNISSISRSTSSGSPNTMTNYSYNDSGIYEIIYANGSKIRYNYNEDKSVASIYRYTENADGESSITDRYVYTYSNGQLSSVSINYPEDSIDYKIKYIDNGFEIYNVSEETETMVFRRTETDEASTDQHFSALTSNTVLETIQQTKFAIVTDSSTGKTTGSSNITGTKYPSDSTNAITYSITSTTSADSFERITDRHIVVNSETSKATKSMDFLQQYGYETVSNGTTGVTTTKITSNNLVVTGNQIVNNVETTYNQANNYRYVYDDNGNLQLVYQLSDGEFVLCNFYAYDEAGQIVTEFNSDGLIYQYSYNSNGNLSKKYIYVNYITLKNYSETEFEEFLRIPQESWNTFDFSSIKSKPLVLSGKPDGLFEINYTNDRVTNYTIKSYEYSDTDTIVDTLISLDITYDSYGNPSKYVNINNEGSWVVSDLTWDGNLLASVVTYDTTNPTVPTYKYTYKYDANGFRTQKTTYEFNTETEDYSKSVSYQYIWKNGLLHSTRLYMYNNGSTTDEMSITMFYDEKGTPVGYNDLTGNPYYFIKDINNNVTGIVDANGKKIASYTYDAFGFVNISGHYGDAFGNAVYALLAQYNPCTFKGYTYDYDTGLYFIENRCYSPSFGRFIDNNKENLFVTSQSPVVANNTVFYSNNTIKQPYGNWVQNTGGLNITTNSIQVDISKAFLSTTFCTVYANQIIARYGTFGSASSDSVYGMTTERIASDLYAHSVGKYAENALNRVNTTWGEGWLKANKDNNSVIIYPNDPYAKVYERIWYASENIRNEALKDGIFLSF